METMHSLLQRQLQRHFGDPASIPPEWQAFVKDVNDTYQEFDVDREKLGHSLELSSQVRLLGSAVDQSMDSIMITDAELNFPGPRITFVNPAFTKMTGYAA